LKPFELVKDEIIEDCMLLIGGVGGFSQTGGWTVAVGWGLSFEVSLDSVTFVSKTSLVFDDFRKRFFFPSEGVSD